MQLKSEDRVLALDPVFGPMGIEAGRAIWDDQTLSMREKAFLLIAADVGVPELGLPFELHVGMARSAAGASEEHLRELLRHIAPDAGFNIVAMAFQKLAELVPSQPHTAAPSPLEKPAAIRHDGALAGLADLDPPLARQAQDQRRRLWRGPGLSARERCLATLAVHVIGGTLGAPFEAHVSLCREAGLTDLDLHVAMRLLAEFSLPKAWQALDRLAQVSRRPDGERPQ